MRSYIPPAAKRDWLVDILGLTILLLIFYLFWLGSYPLFTPDESRYSEVAREMLVTGDFITPRVNGVVFLDKPIMYYWLQALAIHLFGIKEWALRLFPALTGIIGCLTTYICGRHLFNRRTGLISAIILATTPLYFGGAHYANLDLEVAVFISCNLLFFITATQSTSPLRPYFFLAAYIFAALAFLTKGLIGIVFPMMITGLWILLLGRWRLLKQSHLILGTLLFLALVSPWYWLAQKANPQFFHYFFVNQQVTRFLSTGQFNNKTPFWFYIPVLIAGFFPWTIFLIQALNKSIRKVWRAREEYSIDLFLLIWLGFVLLFFSIPNSKTVGYILTVLPAIALLVGSYLSEAWESVNAKSIYWSIFNFALIGTLLATLLIVFPRYQWMDVQPQLTPYLIIVAGIFIISVLAALLTLKRPNFFLLFIICASCSILTLFTIVSGAAYFNENSAKPLVQNLKTMLKPEDDVVTYYKYYQDVPLYLGRQVIIVANWEAADIAFKDNWIRELWYGMAFQKTDDWLINENKFWQRWNSDRRLFVFVNSNYFSQFKKGAQSYFVIGKYNDIILLSNQPTLLALSKHPKFARNKGEEG